MEIGTSSEVRRLARSLQKNIKREASLWLSNNQHRIPLELRAFIFIADVRATITKKSH